MRVQAVQLLGRADGQQRATYIREFDVDQATAPIINDPKVDGRRKPSPQMKGEYSEEIGSLVKALVEMATAADVDKAMQAIAKSTKALLKARSALWKLKDASNAKAAPKAESKPGNNAGNRK